MVLAKCGIIWPYHTDMAALLKRITITRNRLQSVICFRRHFKRQTPSNAWTRRTCSSIFERDKLLEDTRNNFPNELSELAMFAYCSVGVQ